MFETKCFSTEGVCSELDYLFTVSDLVVINTYISMDKVLIA